MEAARLSVTRGSLALVLAVVVLRRVDPRKVTLENFRTHVGMKHGLVTYAQ